jgi:ribosomal protein S18 acetylase RimI-like enzyme
MYVALEDKEEGVCEVKRMCVSDQFRRKGLGLRLVKHILAHAVSENLSRVFLSTPSINASAVSMYAKCGFVFEKEDTYSFEPNNTPLSISTLAFNL